MSSQKPIRLTLDRSASVLSMMIHFAEQGIYVLPVYGVVEGQCKCGDAECTSPGKHPITRLVPHGVKDATTDLKMIRRWHRKYPDMNYAVATDGLTVIDCDSREACRAFRTEFDPPPTFTVKTARGFHHYFRGEMSPRIGIRPKLDIKSKAGSYVVGPVSRHVSGPIYVVWEDLPIAELPESIAGMGAPSSDTDKPNEVDLLPKGQRNTVLTSWAGYLRRLGAPRKAILATLRAANDSLSSTPLADNELRSIASSIAQKPGKEMPQLIPFSQIEKEKLTFLWYPYICLGTLGLLDGNPGDGKSQFCTWICAQISQGWTFPNGDKMEPANCFLFNFEDLPGATIREQLETNGANLNRVFIQSRQFDLSDEMVEWLDEQIAEKKPKFVVLDPIQAFMAGVEANNNVAVRSFMSRLTEIAAKRKCAFLCVRHFGKGAQDKAMMKGIGSTDFVGIARNQFGIARRQDDIKGFIIFHMKTNFERGDSMLFTMGEADGRKGEQPKISFDRFDKMDADAFFAEPVARRGPVQDEREDAKDYLLERLADGPKPVKILKSDAEARAIGASTLNRAGDALGIIKAKGEDARWYWSLPSED